MKFPLYTGNGIKPETTEPIQLPISKRSKFLAPEKYMADPGLKDACNVALLLGQPLLLTGDPGTGKTQFAYSLAWELGLDVPLKFEVKSTSVARDLFYTYDALKRFQDIQTKTTGIELLNYINFQALGLAILRTRESREVEDLLLPEALHTRKSRSVVLIDEIDKAPRDFPNDLLNELEHLYFRVAELKNDKIEVDPKFQPIIIITSNSERDLPEAFLRRCIYFNITFPSSDRLQEIVANHWGVNTSSSRFLQDALDLFYRLRSPQSALRKKPSTAELLSWLLTLQAFKDNNHEGSNDDFLIKSGILPRTLSSLIKTTEDQEKAQIIVEQWIKEQTAKSPLG
jgi:MoxR-like ATPase